MFEPNEPIRIKGTEIKGTVLRQASKLDTLELSHYNLQRLYLAEPHLFEDRWVIQWDGDTKLTSCAGKIIESIDESRLNRD